ncbi:hypothetical protein, partial [Cetobacterium sp.]|uniref:hypothetical protein n=1 Tax=Cetobacterium sp. TaxID=2071632 RepID=UPI003F35BAB9
DIVINNQFNNNFTTLKGFGYDYIQKYEINNNLFKETIYYLNDKFYNCLNDKFFFNRQKEINSQLKEDLEDGSLIEINKESISHFSLNTRLYIAAKEKEINNRNFSLHDIEPRQKVELLPENEFYFLNNKKIFKSNEYKNNYCDFEFDCTGENVLIVSKKESYYNDKIACCSLFLMNDFLLESNNIIFNDRINIRRFELVGKFLEYKYLATSDPFNFVCYKRDFENKNYIYLFDSQELTFANEQNSFKIQTSASKTNFFLINALFKRKVIIDEKLEQLPFYLTNDFQTEDYQTITYGNDPINTWRWKRNNDILKYDSYLAVRVSVNKEKWNYYNKDIASYTCKEKLNDGINTFYFQYQDSNGIWSKTYTHIYHLKTLKPSIPILEAVEYDNQDRGKPLFKWYFDPEIVKYKIIYNNELEYYPITKNYHSPEVSFNLVNSENVNINVEVYAYDKYSNVSNVAQWKFTPNNNNQEPFIMYYAEETNSKKPLIRWKNSSVLTITNYNIRFNSDDFIKTDKLFAYPEKDLNDGLNSFSIYGIDSLGQKTDIFTYYFEVNTESPNIPELTEESLNKTKDCNKKDLILKFELEKSTNSLYYSFDNFLNTY